MKYHPFALFFFLYYALEFIFILASGGFRRGMLFLHFELNLLFLLNLLESGMYQADLRARIIAYDRMRQDKEKVKTLTSKSRSLKKRANSAKSLHSNRSGFNSPLRETRDFGRSLSPDLTRRKFADSITDTELFIPGQYNSNTMKQLLSESQLSRAQSARTLDLSASIPILLSPGRKAMSRIWSSSDLSFNPSTTMLNKSMSIPAETFLHNAQLAKSSSFPNNLINASILHNMKQNLPNSLNSSVSSSSASASRSRNENLLANSQDIHTAYALSMYYQHFTGLQVKSFLFLSCYHYIIFYHE